MVYYVDERTKGKGHAEKLTPIGIKAYPIHAHNKKAPLQQQLVTDNWGEGIVGLVHARAQVASDRNFQLVIPTKEESSAHIKRFLLRRNDKCALACTKPSHLVSVLILIGV